MKTTLTAHFRIEESAWEEIQALALKLGRPLPDVLGELLEVASNRPLPGLTKPEPYQPAPLARLWLQRHPDTILERD